MNDTSKTTSLGRPRLYETSSEKLGAFRERNKEAGYFRKEVLVRQATADKLAAIAKAEGVSVTNTASALLELGIAQYEALRQTSDVVHAPAPAGLTLHESVGQVYAQSNQLKAASPSNMRSLGQAASAQATSSPLEALASSLSAASSSAVANPISSFFESRKTNTK